ncbi:MAG: hypothetical protein WC291_03580 [Thermodesulfovibrionales bacterium]|jgi:hypothetical protein
MRIGEAISVIASFGQPYRLRPLRFKWSGQLMDVKEITYAWETRDGQAKIYRFSVSSGDSLYELSFNADTLLWRLENLDAS